jgi:putative component of membrane protein insertase Oxa1/YidC/SpoIIIJ protein YidD
MRGSRNKRVIPIFLTPVLFSWATFCSSTPPERKEPDSLTAFKPLLYIIRRHREEWSNYDGPRCLMYPSCSAYGETAIRKQGIFGLLLLMDRLFFRDSGTRDFYFITPKRLSEDPRYYDPVDDDLPFHRPSLLREDFAY